MAMYLPKKIKVGFNERSDTYTGKLGYVIYLGRDGEWKKIKSWESWRSKKIDAEEFENTPTEGFVLNKRAGGYRSGWNHRQAYSRIYDPRGFEFEITVDNLLFILENSSSNPGKALSGKFVYAWDRNNLILLPENCSDYQDIVDFSALDGKPISKKLMKEGNIYKNKDNKNLTYVGTYNCRNYISSPVAKFIVFKGDRGYEFFKTMPKFIKDCGPDGSMESIREEFLNSHHMQEFVKFEFDYENKCHQNRWIKIDSSGQSFHVYTSTIKENELYLSYTYIIKDGRCEYNYRQANSTLQRDSDMFQYSVNLVLTNGKRVKI